MILKEMSEQILKTNPSLFDRLKLLERRRDQNSFLMCHKCTNFFVILSWGVNLVNERSFRAEISVMAWLGVSGHSQKFTVGGKALLAHDSKHPRNRAHQVNAGVNHV
jgi:hypothetical protein